MRARCALGVVFLLESAAILYTTVAFTFCFLHDIMNSNDLDKSYGQTPYDSQVFTAVNVAQQRYQSILDRATPYTLYRWLGTLGLLLLFFIRIFAAQAYYIVTYALGIYLLNLFLAFLQPKFDPSLEADIAEAEVEAGAPGLPTSSKDEEFRPFIRRLPEFKFWHATTRAIAFSFIAAFIPAFDIPVYWPILLVYFCVLFALTMRRQIAHMQKYKYLPFDLGRKAQYGGKK